MRSRLTALICSPLAGAALLAGILLTPASAGAATPTARSVTTIQGITYAMAPTGGGAFAAAMVNLSTSDAAVVGFDAQGGESSSTPIPSICGYSTEALGMAIFPGTGGRDFIFTSANNDIWSSVDGVTNYLASLPPNTYFGGVAVGPADGLGNRTAYFAFNDSFHATATMIIINLDAAGHMWSGSEIDDASFSYLTTPSVIGGSVYVTSQVSGELFRITGSTVTTLTRPGTFVHPRNVTGDDQGNLYLTDNGTDTLFRISADGTVTSMGNYGTPAPPTGAPRNIPAPLGQMATALAFDSSTRSLLMARLDTGLYTAKRYCSAPNTTSSILRVLTAPSAPSGVSVTTTGDTATVSWTGASDEVVGDLYTVTASPGGATCTSVAPARTCTITGLSGMTTYSFAVVAQSADGFGEATVTATAATGLAATGDATVRWGIVGLLLSGFGLGLLDLRRRILARA